jgi:membrane-anchored protein YejM (alkaline phosphatase superfamily)
LQIILLIDTKIYTIFHYHINPLVLNIITTEGASDSIVLGRDTIATFSALLLFILLLETLINLYFVNFSKKTGQEKLLFFRKSFMVALLTGLCLIAVEKGMYAYADLVNDTTITKNAKLYPLYQPLTIKRFALKFLHMNVTREENFKVPSENTILKYPKEKLIFDPAKDKRYNIIIIAVEGLRFDNLNKETMPNVWDFGQKNIIYNDHYSGGNGSRFGLFSLLYGIEGTYWHTFLGRRVSPVLIDTLLEKGYDFRILSSTALTFPEFRSTAFVRVPEYIEDTFKTNDNVERDRIMTNRFVDYLSTRKDEKPFFAFLFYNASHQPYNYPVEFEKFQPVLKEELNYFKNAGRDKIDMLRNRYRNAVYFDDALIGKIFHTLREQRLLDRSIVVITGDHGEEFFENGYFGHTSSFDDYQTKTVFVLHHPKTEHHTVERITSHLDLVPTVMESLGCTSPVENYSQGVSLLGNAKRPYIISANWDNASIIGDEVKIIFSTELYRMGTLEVRRKTDYALVENQKEIIRQKRNILFNVSRGMSEFYSK